jgi:hypothetical protein
MDNDGVAFRNRAYEAEKLLELALTFIQEKNLYNDYMRWKENNNE